MSSISRKQSDETMEDKRGVILAEKLVDNTIDSSENVATNAVSGEVVEGQRTDSDRTESKRVSEKGGAGERRSKNGCVSEKRGDGQRSGAARSKRTYDSQRYGRREEVERRREKREDGRYGERENDRYEQSVWREERDSGQRRYWRTSDNARRPDGRDQRSNRARQRGGGGRTSKSSADSAKDQSVPTVRRQREERPRGDAMQPAAGAGVKLKIRNTDKQDSCDPRHKTGNEKLQKATV